MNRRSPEAIQAFIEMLKRPDPPSKATAAWALAEMHSRNPEAVSLLIPMLKDDWTVGEAARALSSIGPEARAAVPGLITVLKTRSGWHRHYAAEALGNIGPDAKTALPALREALSDPYNRVQIAACLAIYKLDPSCKKETLAFLIETLRRDDSGTFWAARALGEMGSEAKEVLPVLLTHQKKSGYYRLPISDAIRKIDPDVATGKRLSDLPDTRLKTN
jgi:HEAT repeat protein